MEKISQVRKFVEALEHKMPDDSGTILIPDTDLLSGEGINGKECDGTTNDGDCSNPINCNSSINKGDCKNGTCSFSTNDPCTPPPSGAVSGSTCPIKPTSFPGLSF